MKRHVVEIGRGTAWQHRFLIFHSRPDFSQWGFIESIPQELRCVVNRYCAQATELSFGIDLKEDGGKVVGIEAADKDGSNQPVQVDFPYLDYCRYKGIKCSPLDIKIAFQSHECMPAVEIIIDLEELFEVYDISDWFPDYKRLKKFSAALKAWANKIDTAVKANEEKDEVSP